MVKQVMGKRWLMFFGRLATDLAVEQVVCGAVKQENWCGFKFSNRLAGDGNQNDGGSGRL